jgi:ABC-type hemin transport system substrate-binding protein
MTIRQSDGEMLTLSQAPQRIVSLDAAATEIFCAVGAGSQLVAVEMYANCPLNSSAKPQVDGFRPSLEAIARYRPTCVRVQQQRGRCCWPAPPEHTGALRAGTEEPERPRPHPL